MVFIGFYNENQAATPVIWMIVFGIVLALFMKTRFTNYKVTGDKVLINRFGSGQKKVLKSAVQSTEFKPAGIRAGTLILNTSAGNFEMPGLSMKSAAAIEGALV
ncbi:MAG: hypothetical protein CMB99_16405 [Flavobacteriaceae bacterium]|nr:hypothetical protein [Flavobacteriaceae bacterium]